MDFAFAFVCLYVCAVCVPVGLCAQVYFCVFLCVCVCVCQKMTRLLAQLKPWTAVSAFLGLISKVLSYVEA